MQQIQAEGEIRNRRVELPPNVDQGISIEQAAAMLGISPATLWRQETKREKYKHIPVPTKVRFSLNRVGYMLKDVQAVLEARQHCQR